MKTEEFIKKYLEALDGNTPKELNELAILSLKETINANGGSVNKSNHIEIKRSFSISFWLKTLPFKFDKRYLLAFDSIIRDTYCNENDSKNKAQKNKH